MFSRRSLFVGAGAAAVVGVCPAASLPALTVEWSPLGQFMRCVVRCGDKAVWGTVDDWKNDKSRLTMECFLIDEVRRGGLLTVREGVNNP